ncbi:MAG: hypothetical protein IPM54_37330 [Polyangiaceae bacterium]|nr:hypothetical protein [Polyangiaceae bacterium]
MRTDHDTEPLIVGPHEFRFVPPNQVRFYLRDTFDGPEVEAHLQFGYKYAELCGGLVECIVDMSQFKRVTESGRQRLTRVERPYPYHGCALLGGSFPTRTIANMIIAAGRVLTPKSFSFPIKFVDTWEDAEAWFQELQAKRRA